MPDRNAFLMVAGITLVPGLLLMAANGMLGSARGWLMFLGLGVGTVTGWAWAMSAPGEGRTIFGLIAATLFAVGFAASVFG